jgi:hypothetical protein
MDPNANLREQLHLTNDIERLTNKISQRFADADAGRITLSERDEKNADDREEIHELAEQLSHKVRDLNFWLLRGGFAPEGQRV